MDRHSGYPLRFQQSRAAVGAGGEEIASMFAGGVSKVVGSRRLVPRYTDPGETEVNFVTRRTPILLLAAGACAAAPRSGDTPSPVAGSGYVTPPAAGKLPIPLHDPRFSRSEYDRMMRELLVFNNFSSYATGPSASTMYMHGGIDFVAPNGTKLFAIDSGIVRIVTSVTPSYKAVTIEDEAHQGIGWQYAHVDGLVVNVGDRVARGALIGVVSFNGVAHLHLNRIRVGPAGWTEGARHEWAYLDVQSRFDLAEAESPVFGKTPLKYFENETDREIAPSPGQPALLTGAVDIAVSAWDRAPFARRDNYAAQLGISRMEYDITYPDGRVVTRSSWNFAALDYAIFGNLAFARTNRQARTIMKYVPLPAREPGRPLAQLEPLYILTNVPPQGHVGRVDPDVHGPLAWQTSERTSSGAPVWPNGTYTITVRIWDAAGNMATTSEVVRVGNPQ